MSYELKWYSREIIMIKQSIQSVFDALDRARKSEADEWRKDIVNVKASMKIELKEVLIKS